MNNIIGKPDGFVPFPLPEEKVSLRDFFAGMALAGLLSNPENAKTDIATQDYVGDAYLFAELMLKQRKKK